MDNKELIKMLLNFDEEDTSTGFVGVSEKPLVEPEDCLTMDEFLNRVDILKPVYRKQGWFLDAFKQTEGIICLCVGNLRFGEGTYYGLDIHTDDNTDSGLIYPTPECLVPSVTDDVINWGKNDWSFEQWVENFVFDGKDIHERTLEEDEEFDKALSFVEETYPPTFKRVLDDIFGQTVEVAWT